MLTHINIIIQFYALFAQSFTRKVDETGHVCCIDRCYRQENNQTGYEKHRESD